MRDGKLQGWAIVENQTDNDWNDVQLSLVSGRPISFIQDLYQPLYVPRPVVQPELYASLRPQTYEGGDADGRRQAEAVRSSRRWRRCADRRRRRMALAKPASLPQACNRSLRTAADEAGPASLWMPTASVASVASAAKIGELFQYTVGNVSLAAPAIGHDPDHHRRRSRSSGSASTTKRRCRGTR